MSFKYINPGYANLLDVDGGTTVTDATKSSTGIALWQPTTYVGLYLSSTPDNLYGKYDVYLSTDGDFEVIVGLSSNGVQIRKSGTTVSLSFLFGGSSVFYQYAYISNPIDLKQKTGLTMNAINTVWFHMQTNNGSSSGTGSYVFYVNGKEMANASRSFSFYTNTNVTVYSKNAYGLISNFILSDEEFNRREQVIILPVDATETTMTDNRDGTYTADAAGEQLLQSIDMALLLAEYGGDSDITRIVLIGNPAYRTAEGLANLTALEKNGETLTEFGTSEASKDVSAAVMQGKSVSLKLSALANYKFGWKAGVGS